MKVVLGRGIDEIKFGMSEKEVVALLGKADKVVIDEEDDDNPVYQYNDKRLHLSFYVEEKGKLGYIRCSHPDLEYNGKKIIGEPVSKVLKEVFSDITDWEIDNFIIFDTYFSEEKWLELKVDFDIVTTIEIGVFVDEDGDYMWKLPE